MLTGVIHELYLFRLKKAWDELFKGLIAMAPAQAFIEMLPMINKPPETRNSAKSQRMTGGKTKPERQPPIPTYAVAKERRLR